MVLDWSSIDTVLLDMDGTLLDLHFDNYFWQIHLTSRYAAHMHISEQEAGARLQQEFARVAGTLKWYCLDYWQAQLGLDMAGLKQEVSHLVRIHAHAEAFLGQLTTQKKIILVTNAHRDSLNLKLEITGIAGYFDAIVSAHDYGRPKEDWMFWQRLREEVGFVAERTLLVEDNLRILDTAKAFGIKHLLAISQPDSQQAVRQIDGYPSIRDFSYLI